MWRLFFFHVAISFFPGEKFFDFNWGVFGAYDKSWNLFNVLQFDWDVFCAGDVSGDLFNVFQFNDSIS